MYIIVLILFDSFLFIKSFYKIKLNKTLSFPQLHIMYYLLPSNIQFKITENIQNVY